MSDTETEKKTVKRARKAKRRGPGRPPGSKSKPGAARPGRKPASQNTLGYHISAIEALGFKITGLVQK